MTRRILYISESEVFGGAERYFQLLWAGLDRSAFEPIAGVPRNADWLPKDGSVTRIAMEPVVGKWDLMGLWRQRDAIRKLSPDVVHLNLSNPLHGQFTMLASEAAGVPARLVTMHLPPRSGTPTRRGRALEALSLKRLDNIIAVCGSSQRLMVSHLHLDTDRTTIVYNGIDLEAFDREAAAVPTFPLPESRPLLAAVGRMTDQKGFDVLIDAVGIVAQTHPGVRLVIAGDGPLRNELEVRARSEVPGGQVLFLGAIDEVPALLSAADAFVLSSRYESFPFAVLEAMTAGKPVVATDVDGVPEAVDQDRTGFLVAPDDPGALAEALLQIVDDPQSAIRMGQAARKKVEARFAAADMVTNTEAVYYKCLGA